MNRTQEQCSGTPATHLGVLRGIREWEVDKLGRLKAMTNAYTWRPGENQAICASMRRLSDLCRSLSKCMTGHGFYAYHDGVADFLHKNDTLTPSGPVVSGVIHGYGEAVYGTRGFRCEKAKIVALSVEKSYVCRLHTASLAEDIRCVFLAAVIAASYIFAAVVIDEPLALRVAILTFGLFAGSCMFFVSSIALEKILKVHRHNRGVNPAANGERHRLAEHLRQLYGVPVYLTEKEMLANHPVDTYIKERA